MNLLGKYVNKTIIGISIIALGFMIVTGVINSNANENEKSIDNPEAMLIVSFKEGVYLDNIIDNELNPDKNWQGMKFDNNFRIIGLSGVSDFGGQEEMVSINGHYTNKSIKRAYLNKYKDLLIKLDDIKNNGSEITGLSEVNKHDLTNETKKMNSWQLKKQRYWNWHQSKILDLKIVGGVKTLLTIKEILTKSNHTKFIDFNEINVFKNSIETTQIEIDKNLSSKNLPQFKDLNKSDLSKSEIEEINTIINENSQKFVAQFQNSSKNEIEKKVLDRDILNSINFEKINQSITINNYHKIELNSDFDKDLIQSGYSNDQIQLIKQMIEEYNSLKEYRKVDLNALSNASTSSIETISSSAISSLTGGISAKAGWCEHNIKINLEWWRIWTHINQCSIETLNYFSDVSATVIGLLTATPWSWACGIIAGVITINKAWIGWLNSRCGGDGVMFNRIHNGITYFWAVC
ncbi:MAG: hypothetical protein ACRCXZ_05775 [Patescibacteria group bacterium]